jgi:hypothetical protein
MFNINCITVDGDPINGQPRGSKTKILTENDPEYRYYAEILPVWAIR